MDSIKEIDCRVAALDAEIEHEEQAEKEEKTIWK